MEVFLALEPVTSTPNLFAAAAPTRHPVSPYARADEQSWRPTVIAVSVENSATIAALIIVTSRTNGLLTMLKAAATVAAPVTVDAATAAAVRVEADALPTNVQAATPAANASAPVAAPTTAPPKSIQVRNPDSRSVAAAPTHPRIAPQAMVPMAVNASADV